MPRRRRKNGALEDLFDIAVMLPWWAGLLLAVITFIGLHSVVQMEIVSSPQPSDLGHNISRQLFKTFASILQYVIPAIFCLGAAGSFFGRLKRRKLFDRVQNEQTTLSQLSWQEFELLVGEAFRQRGYTVAETGSGADGGVDLVLMKNHERFLVQCKHWKSAKVSIMVVRELLGVMTSAGAKGGFVVASGVFTKDAESFAKNKWHQLDRSGRTAPDDSSRKIQYPDASKFGIAEQSGGRRKSSNAEPTAFTHLPRLQLPYD